MARGLLAYYSGFMADIDDRRVRRREVGLRRRGRRELPELESPIGIWEWWGKGRDVYTMVEKNTENSGVKVFFKVRRRGKPSWGLARRKK